MNASITAADCAASVVQPKTLPPKQRTLTSRSVRPSLRLSIGASPPEWVGRGSPRPVEGRRCRPPRLRDGLTQPDQIGPRTSRPGSMAHPGTRIRLAARAEGPRLWLRRGQGRLARPQRAEQIDLDLLDRSVAVHPMDQATGAI